MLIAWASLCSVLNKLCDIVPEILIGISVDVVVNQHQSIVARMTGIVSPSDQVYLVAGLTALLWIGESIFEYLYLIAWRGIAHGVQHDMRSKVFAHVQSLDMAHFEHVTTGGLLSVMNDDINQLELFLSEAPNAIIQLLVNVVVIGSLFFFLSPTLALLTLCPIPFVVMIAFYFQKRLAALYARVRDAVEALSGFIASRLSGVMTIKTYNTESFEQQGLIQKSLEHKAINAQANAINAAYIPVVRMGVLCGFIMSLLVGGHHALNGTLSISFYTTLVFLTQRFLWPFTTVTTITDMYERAKASANRVFALLAKRPSIRGGMRECVHAVGSIAFDTVSFAYGNGVPVLNNISFTVQPKTTVAFVGSTGSGKSTIIKTLLRLYDVQRGAITLDGVDCSSYTLASLRQMFGLVSQDVYLINGTVAQNIAYGSPRATHDEIVAVSRMASAHEFIMALPQGYETVIGENGKNLSGGQRQRLAIARAMLKNPAIFLFDEATSALDNETEAAVQRSMQELAHKHTVVIIAHRLSTIRHADTIFVMDKGRIVEQGTHEELSGMNGAYAALLKAKTE